MLNNSLLDCCSLPGIVWAAAGIFALGKKKRNVLDWISTCCFMIKILIALDKIVALVNNVFFTKQVRMEDWTWHSKRLAARSWSAGRAVWVRTEQLLRKASNADVWGCSGCFSFGKVQFFRPSLQWTLYNSARLSFVPAQGREHTHTQCFQDISFLKSEGGGRGRVA